MTKSQRNLVAVSPVSRQYVLSRLNAVRHGVLSKCLVLPWEDREEYQKLLDELVADHHPAGQTEHYLVGELADIMWRKRRLASAESALNHDTLKRAFDNFLVGHLREMDKPKGLTPSCPDPFLALASGSQAQIDQCHVDLKAYRTQTLKSIILLNSSAPDAYERGAAALHEHTRRWFTRWTGQMFLATENDPHSRVDGPEFFETARYLRAFLRSPVLRWCDRCRQLLEDPSLICAAAFGDAIADDRSEKLRRYEITFDRKFQATLAMLVQLQKLRRDGLGNESVVAHC